MEAPGLAGAPRTPKDGDLIVPTINLTNRDVRKALEDFLEDLERLHLRKRRQYDARRTFTSLALSGGAPKDLVRWITHPRPADQDGNEKGPEARKLRGPKTGGV